MGKVLTIPGPVPGTPRRSRSRLPGWDRAAAAARLAGRRATRVAALVVVAAAAPGAAGRALAQVATVSGVLVNHDSRAPIEGARISIIGTSLSASSDARGRFEVTGVPAGVRVMQIHAIGYAVGSWLVQLTEGQTLGQTFELSPRALEVEGVTVRDSATEDSWRSERAFETRRRTGRGFFLTREQIQERNAQTITDLLRTVPGIMSVCNSRACSVRMLRSGAPCPPEYFLDGYPATFSTGPNFPVQQIRGVEIYRDQFEAPSEFQRPNLQCGVIAIWTVEPGTPLGRH